VYLSERVPVARLRRSNLDHAISVGRSRGRLAIPLRDGDHLGHASFGQRDSSAESMDGRLGVGTHDFETLSRWMPS